MDLLGGDASAAIAIRGSSSGRAGWYMMLAVLTESQPGRGSPMSRRACAYAVLSCLFLCGLLIQPSVFAQEREEHPAPTPATATAAAPSVATPPVVTPLAAGPPVATSPATVPPVAVPEARWQPSDVDEDVPPVDPNATCNLDEVLRNAGKRIQEFVGNVERFSARENMLQETINKSGKVSGWEKRKYDYLVSITEIRPGVLDVSEDLRGVYSPFETPGGLTGINTKGLPALVLIFHPMYAPDFSMKCEGLGTVNGESGVANLVPAKSRSAEPHPLVHVRTERAAPPRGFEGARLVPLGQLSDRQPAHGPAARASGDSA